MKTINKTTGNGHKPIQQLAQSGLELLPLIMNNIPQAVFWKDRNLVYLGCNRAFAEDTGFSSPEEVIGKTDFDMPWKEQAELYCADDRLVMESGESKLNYEEPQTTPDGSTIWLSTSKIPMRENGQVVAVLGMYEDVTVRKRTEQAIKESEEKFKAIADNTAVGLFIYQDGIVRYVGREAARLLGYDVSETIGRSIMDFIHPDERQHIADMVRRRTARENVPDQYETRMLKKDGSALDVLMFGIMIEYEGKPATQGAFLDLTVRKQAEQAIHETEERFQRFTEATVEGLVFHEQGKIVDANPAAIAMFGFSNVTGLIGRNLLEFVVPDSHELVLKQMQLESVQPYEIQGIRKDGSTFPMETSTRAYKTGKRTIRASSLRDITERKQAEADKLREKNVSDATINSLPGIFYMFDTQGNLVRRNKNYETVAGYLAGETATRTALDAVAEEDREHVAQAIQRAFTEGKVELEMLFKTRHGEKIPYLMTAVRMTIGDDMYVVGTGIDLSERKRAEQTLQESEARYSAVVNQAGEGIIIIQDNIAQFANKALGEMLGYTPDEMVGTPFINFVAPESKALLASRVKARLAGEDVPLVYEARLLRKDGTIFDAELSAGVIQYRGKSADVGLIRDVTERKRLEQQIQTAFERRGRQVQLSTQVSQSIAAATSLDELYQRVVTQVKEQFGYYHAQLLRYDAAQNAVVLITGYGETGAKMLSAGHRLPMGQGLIGTAAASGQTVLRPALTNDPDWHPNPLLPETKGEIAVPIKLGDNILGVLDVQSNVVNALGADDQLVLEGLCGQIATAIESTRLRQEMGERLEEINRLYQAMSHEGWQTYRETSDVPEGFMFDQSGLRPVKNVGLAEEFFSNLPLTVPGGEVIGTLAVADDPQHPISPEDQTFVQQVSEQVALALESARLFDQTQMALSEVARRASELETVARVSATTSTVLDPDNLLQSVVDLTKERFNLYHAHIYLADDSWKTLLLAAGAGEVGRKMVAEEHTIALDAEKSLVARAARERQAVIVNDVRDDPTFLPNPLLPEARSEMAIPMIVGDKVLGVFDVQSDKQDGFTKEDANIYTTLASQVAVALQNARLYAEQAAAMTQLRELDRLKTSFLANMSHELRTPLNSILGFSDVILEGLDGPVTEQMDNDLRLIGKNGQHLLHLINDVLDMSKIDAGRMNLQPEKFKLNGLFEEAINITSSLAGVKSLSLVIKEDSDRMIEVFADRTRLQQVMINLINNAIKFTERGEVSLKARQKKDQVLIEIHDTGIGIPPEQIQTIFQEFTQVDTSTTRKTGGTGLGLPISRRLIELHGGRLWAESTGVAGEGSTFYVELPLIAKMDEPAEKKER